jgi:hypothetical protein
MDVGGYWRWPAIRIRPRYENDEGLHRHELEHARQWWTLPFLHAFLYTFFRRYRLWVEARAYRIQMKHPDAHGVLLSLDGAAARLMNPRYQLNLTMDEAKELLR